MSIARSHSSGKGEAAASADFTKLSPALSPVLCPEKKKKASAEKKTRQGQWWDTLYLPVNESRDFSGTPKCKH